MSGVLDGAGWWVIAGVAGALALWWLVRLVRQTRRTAHTADLDLRDLIRRDASIGSLGRATGLLALFALAGPFGAWQFRSGMVAVAGVITAVILVSLERWWPRPRGLYRTAAVTRRGWRGMTSRTAGVSTGLSFIALIAAAIWSVPIGVKGHTLSGAGPDPFGSGRTVGVKVDDFPGWTVVALAVVAVAVTTAAAIVGIHAAVNRPAMADVSAAVDLRARRATADRLLRLVGIVAVLTADLLFESARSAWQLYGSKTGTSNGWLAESHVLQAVCVAVVFVLLEVGRTRIRMPDHRGADRIADVATAAGSSARPKSL